MAHKVCLQDVILNITVLQKRGLGIYDAINAATAFDGPELRRYVEFILSRTDAWNADKIKIDMHAVMRELCELYEITPQMLRFRRLTLTSQANLVRGGRWK